MYQKGSKREHKILSIESKVNAVAIKCYEEQLVDGIDALIKAIRGCNKEIMFVLVICHDRDEQTDGVWKVSKEKKHYHILVKYRDRKKKVRVNEILEMLHIKFREGLDDTLLENRGIESIGSFVGYAMYLTHETDDAIRDNKEIYDISEIISNLTEQEIKHIRAGYLSIEQASEKVTPAKMAELDEKAFELGRNLGNFTSWYNAQPFSVRSNCKMRTVKESYDRGVQARLEEGREVNRLCIYIQGAPNTGKTYAVKQSLRDKCILEVSGGGTGKFDRLRPDHEVILIDDDICPNLLNMSDNYICHAYRRQSGNPVWAGDYFIVTSNLTFDQWLDECGIKSKVHKEAVATRFFICILEEEKGINRLALVQPSTRGAVDRQCERANKFVEFQKLFNAVIEKYNPKIAGVNYDAIIDKKYISQSRVETIKEQMAMMGEVIDNEYSAMVLGNELQKAQEEEVIKANYYNYQPPQEEKKGSGDYDEARED